MKKPACAQPRSLAKDAVNRPVAFLISPAGRLVALAHGDREVLASAIHASRAQGAMQRRALRDSGRGCDPLHRNPEAAESGERRPSSRPVFQTRPKIGTTSTGP